MRMPNTQFDSYFLDQGVESQMTPEEYKRMINRRSTAIDSSVSAIMKQQQFKQDLRKKPNKKDIAKLTDEEHYDQMTYVYD